MSGSLLPLPEGTHTIVLGVGDVNGVMRGKRIPASNWATTCEDGKAICAAIFALDMTSDIWDTPFCSFDNGYPDVHLFPLAAPPVAVPWEPGVAITLGRTETLDHKPVPIDPRVALLTQVERAARLGLTIEVGTELEFYLLDPETKRPKDKGISVYGIGRSAQFEPVLGPIRRHLEAIGIPIEQSNPEYAPGRVEVNIRHAGALTGADRVVLFRTAIKEIAALHGYLATFMAKPFIDQSGSGFHAHYSVWREGVNLFADGGRLSRFGRSFLAGLERRIAESALAVSTTPNAFRRRRPYTFCPTNVSWGFDNRTIAFRVIEGKDHQVRIEKRDGSADANPYYLLAADIAAGLDGIEEGLELTSAPISSNAYEQPDLPPLPRDLPTAVRLARSSEFLRRVIGEDRLSILVRQAEREIDFLEAQVTPVETKRYLVNF
ncbi:glutamine synthetase catalytic region [Rhodomicrobium vannielii ATCC 17100]|uniref:Glutamine synthetase catalytic region n=1 Tax=Rhodomicrobium vannielii (strain ATCC 17100 / DSM 162 / LMG 4299 / NCIMB 10020 / ATH 3.1.1) TaxID=648757 RepID=E3I2M3_RHOVT|nr:glutamine synthetase family protein [Rhodomicrobium vannielii]ADP71382.1 glutamine synthetase catalytic region [Rhodomicrobium vannielii ATCC 17100]